MPSNNTYAQAVDEQLVKKFIAQEGRQFVHTQLITHKGILVAIVLDDKQHFFYSVLDFNGQDATGNSPVADYDYKYWTPLAPVPFTNELSTTGEGSIGSEQVPLITKDDKIDIFLSTTARFTADAPFQVLSDNQHIYLFRTSVAQHHPRMFNSANPNQPLWSAAKSEQLGSSLLVDRYLLTGSALLPKLEVRYRRSRKKDTPASNIDTLGTTDMANRPFIEATQILGFVEHLQEGQFRVLLLPTQVSGVSRWQIFAYNAQTQLMDSWNLEKSTDGLFDTKGNIYYTSPDPRYKSQVFERAAGPCPITGDPMVPLANRSGFAESALYLSKGSHLKVPYSPLLNPADKFTVEGWIKTNGRADNQKIIGNFNQSGYLIALKNNFLQIEAIVTLQGRHDQQLSRHITLNTVLPVPTEEWFHFAVTFQTRKDNRSAHIRAFINGEQVGFETDNLNVSSAGMRTHREQLQTDLSSYTEITPSRAALTIGVPPWDPTNFQFDGTIDEIRVWKEVRQAKDIKANMYFRLQGNEPGLLAYWRFDEGQGTTVKDLSNNNFHGTLHANALTQSWVESTAPIGDTTDMKRDSFSFSNSSIVGPPGAVLYYQREAATTEAAESIQNARVMLAIPTAAQLSGKAMYFDGKTSLVKLPGDLRFDFSAGLTIEGWIKIDKDIDGVSSHRLLHLGTKADTYNKQTLFLNVRRHSGKDTAYVEFVWASNILAKLDHLPIGEWLHIAFVGDPKSGFKAYQNGQLQVENSRSLGVAISHNNYDESFIGAGDVNQSYGSFHGALTDLRIWTHQRSTIDIKNYKDHRLDGKEDNHLTANWYLDEQLEMKNHTANQRFDGSREGARGEVSLPAIFPEVPAGIATIDFGVTREGKLAQIPDVVDLEVVGQQATDGATTAELIKQVNDKKIAIADRLEVLQADILQYTVRWKEGLQDKNIGELLLAAQGAINNLREFGSFSQSGIAIFDNKKMEVDPIAASLEVDFRKAKHLTFSFRPLPDKDGVSNRYRIVSDQGGLLQVKDVDFDSFTALLATDIKQGKILVLGPAGHGEEDTFIITKENGELNIRPASMPKAVLYTEHLKKTATLNRELPSENLVTLLNFDEGPKGKRYPLSSEFVKDKFSGYDDPLLQQLQKEWQALKEELKVENRYNMPLLHVDSFGASSSAGLLSFAHSKSAPYLLANAEGDVAMYFRSARQKLFSSAYFDTRSRKLQQQLNTDVGKHINLLTRSTDKGYQDTTITITDGPSAAYCTVEITNDTTKVKESWQRVPRIGQQFSRVINGVARKQSSFGKLTTANKPLSTTECYVDRPISGLLSSGASIIIGAGEQQSIGTIDKLDDPKAGQDFFTQLNLNLPATIHVLKGTRIYLAGHTGKNSSIQQRELILTADLNIGDTAVQLKGLPAVVAASLDPSLSNKVLSFYPGKELIVYRSPLTRQVMAITEETLEQPHPQVADKTIERTFTKLTFARPLPYLVASGTPIFGLEYDYSAHAQACKTGASHLLLCTALHPNARLLNQSVDFGQSSSVLTAWKSNSPGHALHLPQGSIATKQQIKAIVFNGENRAQSPVIPIRLEKGISIEFSVYPSKFTVDNTNPVILRQRGEVDQFFFNVNSNGDLSFSVVSLSGTANASLIIEEKGVISLQQWHHITATVTRDGNTKLYLNGDLLKEKTLKLPWTFPFTNDLQFQGVLGRHFVGQMDNIRLWNQVLNDNEVKFHAQKRVSGSEENLIANWYYVQDKADPALLKNHSLLPNLDAWFVVSPDHLPNELDENKTVVRRNEYDVAIPTAPISAHHGLSAKHLSALNFVGDTTLECWIKAASTNTDTNKIASEQYLIHNNGLLRLSLGLSEVNTRQKTAKVVIGVNDRFKKSTKAAVPLDAWQHIAARFKPAYALRFANAYLDCGGGDYYNFNAELTIAVNLKLGSTEGNFPLLSKGKIKTSKDDGVPFALSIQDGAVVLEYEDHTGTQLARVSAEADLRANLDHEIVVIRRKRSAPATHLKPEELTNFFNMPDLPSMGDLDIDDLNENYILTEKVMSDGTKGSLTKLKEEYQWKDDDPVYKALRHLNDKGYATENDLIADLKKTEPAWIKANLEAIVSAADTKVRLRVDNAGRANMLKGMNQKSKYEGGGLLNAHMQGLMGSYSLNEYVVEMYLDGKKLPTTAIQFLNSSAPIGRNYAPLQIGRIVRAQEQNLLNDCTINEVRLWAKTVDLNDNESPILAAEDLASHWQFKEYGAQYTSDGISALTANFQQPEGGRLIWAESTQLGKRKLELLLNGQSIAMDYWTPSEDWTKHGATQFTLGGKLNEAAQLDMEYLGQMEEIRVWNRWRTEEELLDNMYTRLRENINDLVAYYSCNADAMLLDAGNGAHHLTLHGNLQTEFFPISDAPIGIDVPQVQPALASLAGQAYAAIDSSPMVQEYGDLQESQSDRSRKGILKRCYAYVANGEWVLVTGFKVGNLISEWIGQVQFNPQIMGYVEGAPPVPSENLTEAQLLDSGHTSRTYVGTSSVEMEETENVTYTLSHSKEGGFNSSFDIAAQRAIKAEIELVIAPFGIGMNFEGTVEFGGKLQFGLESSSSFNISNDSSVGRNTSKSLSVSLGGAWEDEKNPVNGSLSRRFLAANMGFALVQSDTADVFALRMAHNGQLVSNYFRDNPDIPKDVNIIPFPINPRYTKQGTLDGRVGYNKHGVVLDPDYKHAQGLGEFSYFKPKEAYSLKREIQQRKEKLMAELAETLTRSDAVRKALGPFGAFAAGGAAAGAGYLAGSASKVVAKSNIGMELVKFAFLNTSNLSNFNSQLSGVGAGVAGAVGAITNLATTITNVIRTAESAAKDLPRKFSERDIANTYVWTADGGFYAETTSLVEAIQEVTASSYQFKGDLSNGMLLNIGADLGPQFSLELNGSMGGELSTTKTKTRSEDRSFSLKVVADPPGDLQKFEKNADGKWERVYVDGAAVNVSGKVDAYRFMTFYLQPSSANFDELFNRVIDPMWLLQSDHPNAVAMRQANYAALRPPCYRIMHRVTFVSRILPEFPDTTAPPLERLMRDIDINSHWELIRRVDPFIPAKVSDPATDRNEFISALRYAINTYLPHLDWENTAVRNDLVDLFTAYYGIQENRLT